jgi:hypothetical protein
MCSRCCWRYSDFSCEQACFWFPGSAWESILPGSARRLILFQGDSGGGASWLGIPRQSLGTRYIDHKLLNNCAVIRIFLIFALLTAKIATIRGGEMKRILLLFLAILLSCSLVSAVAQAENFPAGSSVAGQPQKIAPPSANQQQMFYGYVPPAPIRHTWPGGYKVIFSELTNTLIEHILGQY